MLLLPPAVKDRSAIACSLYQHLRGRSGPPALKAALHCFRCASNVNHNLTTVGQIVAQHGNLRLILGQTFKRTQVLRFNQDVRNDGVLVRIPVSRVGDYLVVSHVHGPDALCS